MTSIIEKRRGFDYKGARKKGDRGRTVGGGGDPAGDEIFSGVNPFIASPFEDGGPDGAGGGRLHHGGLPGDRASGRHLAPPPHGHRPAGASSPAGGIINPEELQRGGFYELNRNQLGPAEHAFIDAVLRLYTQLKLIPHGWGAAERRFAVLLEGFLGYYQDLLKGEGAGMLDESNVYSAKLIGSDATSFTVEHEGKTYTIVRYGVQFFRSYDDVVKGEPWAMFGFYVGNPWGYMHMNGGLVPELLPESMRVEG